MTFNVNLPDTVTFEAKLPKFLGNGEDEVFFRVVAYPTSGVNPAYQVGMEGLRPKIIANSEKFKDDKPASMITDEELEAMADVGRDRFAVIYNTAVVSWETNILNNGKRVVEFDCETFMALTQVKLAVIAEMFMAFNDFLTKSAEDLLAFEEKDLKNSLRQSLGDQK